MGVQFNDSKCQRPTCRAAEARAEAAEAALATARAVAMEEAARWHEEMAEEDDHDEHRFREAHVEFAANLRALASLPAGLVVVPVPTFKAMEDAIRGYFSVPHSNSYDLHNAALEALKAVKR